MNNLDAPTGHVPQWHEGRDLDALANLARCSGNETLAAAVERARPEQAAASEARENLAVQDADFRARRISLNFGVEGIPEIDPTDSYGEYDPSRWPIGSDGEPDPALAELVRSQIVAAMDPWISHFNTLGLVRADDFYEALNGEPSENGNPIYFLICRATDDGGEPDALGDIGQVQLKIDALPGATLRLAADVWPINATLLYDTLRTKRPQLGWWGGDPTGCLLPQEDEARDHWLSRVAMPLTRIHRSVERWKRSGGNLTLYGLCGSATERAVGDQPIGWVIPGLVPRGYVSLLVGTKMAGKSTLLGEMAAVFDSQYEGSRSILGIEVQDRGVACIVSGEDGDNFINRRGAYYADLHGDRLGFVIDTSLHPWPETLELLRDMPNLDFLCVDPLRAMLIGDEDASSVISPFFDDLNELARKKNCGVVLVHHISKNVPRSLSAMLKVVRGSSVATDRPRVVIGMLDRGAGVTEVGIIKHNMPPSEAMWSEINVGRLFRRDAATLTLVPVEGAPRSHDVDAHAPVSLELIFEAIERQNQLGLVLRRTGRHELYERKLPQLAGLSRNIIRDNVATLLAARRLKDDAEGLRTVAQHD